MTTPRWDPYESEHTMLMEKIEHDAEQPEVFLAVIERMKEQYLRAGYDIENFGLHFLLVDWAKEYPGETYDGFVIVSEIRSRSLQGRLP